MSSLPIKMLKDESGNKFIPLASTLGISSNGKMLNEEITDILNRIVGLDYVPARLDIVTSTDETGPSFEEINCSVVILEFGKMTTGESLINFGDYELKTNSVNSENFTFELTNGTTSYTSNYIDKDVIFDMYNRLIFSFNGTSWVVGINGISGGIISAPGVQGIPCEGLSISGGRDFALFRLYISTSLITGLDVIGASGLDFDIDRKVRPYACFMYYRNLTNNTLKNEGTGTESLDWTISQGAWVPGYNLVERLSYQGLSQKPSINGVTLAGNKTTEDLLIESGGVSDYNDLENLPKLNTDNTDSQATASEEIIQNIIKLHKISKTGNYSDLNGKPIIPAAQIQSDWNQETNTALDYIKNKPIIPSVPAKATGVEVDIGTNDSNYVTPKAIMDSTLLFQSQLAELVDAIILAKHPIGTIEINVSGTNPSTYIGGTWVAWGTGRVPVGVDTSQTEFNTVEKTGGNKYMQAHSHTMDSQGWHSHNVNVRFTGGYGSDYAMSWTNGLWQGPYQNCLGAFTMDGSGSHTHNIASSGSGDSQNLQPYITCYMWKRTA
jgi:hypothetical protein